MRVGYHFAAITPGNYSSECIKNNDHIDAEEEIQRLVDSIKDKTGIVPKHLFPLQQVASELHCILSIRPVDRLATDLIEAGHPTKGFHIKGKSASWGPQAGLICEEQRFSKLEGASVECIHTFNLQIQECMKAGYATAIDLTITRHRLNTLLEKGIVDNLSLESACGVRSFTSKAPSGELYAFEARRTAELDEEQYSIVYNNQPIRVLAPTENALPFTTDYDLLMIAPHISDLGSQDNVYVPDVSHKVLRQRVDSYHKTKPADHPLMQDYTNARSFYQKESPEIGNASERIRQLIGVINTALVGDGEAVIHHSVDAFSPATDLASNYPATFALPEKIGRFEKLCIIEDGEALQELITAAQTAGYAIRVNPLWGEAFTGIRSQHFEKAREQVMRKLKGLL